MTVDVDIVRIEHLPDDLQGEARGFVIATWRDSFHCWRPKRMDPGLYRRRQRDLALRLLSEADTKIVTLLGAPDLFVGWVCRKGPLLHYVYVKDGWRRLGVASRLVDGVEVCTHSPTHSYVRNWAQRMGVEYDPYQLMR